MLAGATSVEVVVEVEVVVVCVVIVEVVVAGRGMLVGTFWSVCGLDVGDVPLTWNNTYSSQYW